jgi:hypothetical protein
MESVNVEPDLPKYVVMKASEFWNLLGFAMRVGPGNWDEIDGAAAQATLTDAVVIRRQDLLAAPALATYADCIGLVSKTTNDKDLQAQLTRVADYFQQQAHLAADEGYKWPD